jgi:hypothetical protein
MDRHSGRSCETCGGALDADQRYCLNCGNRAGPRDPALLEMKRRAGAPASREPSPPEPDPGPPAAGLRLPTPRISALLVLVFLGFGTLLGSAAGSRPSRLAADVSPRLKLVVPAPASSAATPSTSTQAAEAPESEPEKTPEAEGSSTGKSKAAGSKAKSSESESETETETGEKKSSEEEKSGESKSSAAKPATALPSFKHVFLIVLSDEPYAAMFGPEAKARYLAGTLEKKGELLLRYDAIAHEQLANEIALVSGQGPNAQTAANCPTYTALTPGGAGAEGQVLGSGCVYPASTPTLAGQLAAQHLTWKAYIQGIDEPGAAPAACAHPALGAGDPTFGAGPYATFRDPFVYFESVTSSSTCAADVVGLGALAGDLSAGAESTPSLAYIVPDRCHDGGPTSCAPGAPSGPADADGFLESVVPEILASKAYKAGGLLVITSDEAPSSGESADSSSCCGQPAYPNLPPVEGHGRGGGAVGALLISPDVPAGKTSGEQYNHFSLLRTIEDTFKLPHLGYAGLSAVKSLAPELFITPGKG